MKWKVYILKVKKLISFAYVLLCSTFFSAVNVFASADVGSSKLATGTTKLIDDLTKLLMVLDIPITILLVAYFSVRKGGADEQDQKMWHKRIVTSLICGVIALTASAIVNVVAGYYR